jgi:peptidoglycan/xylan/chitin deacetylase (PgdA/CDA1 family)
MVALSTLALLLFAADGGAPSIPDGGAPSIPTFAIRGVTTSEPVVALTFDACATLKQPNGFDRKVFEILAARAIADAPLIELGNHSYSHPRLTLVRKERLRWQIRHTNQVLEKKLGRRPLSLRPPAGAWNAKVLRAARDENLPVVTWTVVSGDVGGHVPPARMVQTVLDETKPGAIIIFHINRREPYTKKALPDIIAGLRGKGFRFVTVSQLLALPDATAEPAKPSRLGFHKRNRPPAPEHQNAEPAPEPPSQGGEPANPPT